MRQLLRLRLLIATSLLVALYDTCVGGSLTWELHANAPGFGSSDIPQTTASQSDPFATVAMDDQVEDEDSQGHALAKSSGIAEYGRVGVAAHTEAASTSLSKIATSQAFVRVETVMELEMTPSSSSMLGEPAKGINDWKIHGNLSTLGSFTRAYAAYGFYVAVGQPHPWTYFDASSAGIMKDGVLTVPPESSLQVPIGFHWGDTVSIAIGATANAIFDSLAPGGGNAQADFSQTFLWGGITVTDLQGNPIEGFQALDALGRDWSQPLPEPLPEPSTSILLSVSLVGLCSCRALRRRNLTIALAHLG